MALLAFGISGAAAAQSEPGSEPGLPAVEGSPPVGTEDEDGRTSNTQTFLRPDGSYETRVYGAPVNYLDAQGDWRPVDESLEESAGATLANGANSFDVTLPARLTNAPILMEVGDSWVSSQYLGADTATVDLEGETAVYETPDGDTAFEFTGLPNGLKEDIQIADASQPNRFAFLLEASQGSAPPWKPTERSGSRAPTARRS